MGQGQWHAQLHVDNSASSDDNPKLVWKRISEEKREENMSKESSSMKKTYRMAALLKFVYLGVYPVSFLSIIFIFLLLPGEDLTRQILMVFCLGVGILGLCYLSWASANTYLSVSPDGVEYSGWDVHVYIPWHSIRGIGRVPEPYRQQGLVNAFLFKSPVAVGRSIKEGKQRGIAVMKKRWYVFTARPEGYVQSLPIYIDHVLTAPDISHHEIATYLRHYAPQILGETAE